MTESAQQAFTKLVAMNGLLYPATSVRPRRADKAALRRLKRQAQRRHHDAPKMAGPRKEAA